MKKKSIRVITVFTVVCALVAIASALFNSLLPLYLAYKFNVGMGNIKNASSIGIIGGSDGPTAIFISGQSNPYLITIIFAFLAVVGVVFLIANKRTVKNK